MGQRPYVITLAITACQTVVAHRFPRRARYIAWYMLKLFELLYQAICQHQQNAQGVRYIGMVE